MTNIKAKIIMRPGDYIVAAFGLKIENVGHNIIELEEGFNYNILKNDKYERHNKA